MDQIFQYDVDHSAEEAVVGRDEELGHAEEDVGCFCVCQRRYPIRIVVRILDLIAVVLSGTSPAWVPPRIL